MMRHKVIDWLRWLAVIPGGLVAAVLMSFPLHLVLYSSLFYIVKPYPEAPERILMSFVMAISFIVVGAYIAPKYKWETVVALFGVLIFVLGGFVYLALAGIPVAGQQLYLQYGGVSIMMAFFGAIAGLGFGYFKIKR